MGGYDLAFTGRDSRHTLRYALAMMAFGLMLLAAAYTMRWSRDDA